MYSGSTPESVVLIHSGVCSHTGVCSLGLLRGLEPRVTPEAVIWSLESFRVCSLESLQSLKSRRSLESAFTESAVWPGVCSHSGCLQSGFTPKCLEVGVFPESVVTPEFVVWSYSGVCSSRVTEAGVSGFEVTPDSLRCLEVVSTLDPGVWIHSGSRSLDSLRCLQSGFTPESAVWIHSGVWRLESLRSL